VNQRQNKVLVDNHGFYTRASLKTSAAAFPFLP
jgi:hypothetical protein